MRLIVLILALAVTAPAQQPIAPTPASASTASAPEPAQQLAAREFGPSFTVDAAFAPMFGDLDGDGQEDAVLVALSKTPLADEAGFNYRTLDPYSSYFGWTDPKATIQFTETNTGPARYLLVVHNWRAPKAKFLLINVPFEKAELGRISRKKKALTSIHLEESGGLGSDLFWDGKKYRWEATYLGK